MIAIDFKRNSAAIDDDDLRAIGPVVKAHMADGTQEQKTYALLLAKMMFRISELKEAAPAGHCTAPATITDQKIKDIWNSLGYRTRFSNFLLRFGRALLSYAASLPGQTEQPSLSDAEIVDAVDAAHARGRIALTFINIEGVEKPTDVARSLARALLAQRQHSEKDARIVRLERLLTSDKDADKIAALERRYLWAVNELLACDHGDNDQGEVGWIVYGWRDQVDNRRIYGDDADSAIDRAIANGAKE